MKETILNVLRNEHREVALLMNEIFASEDLATKKRLYLDLEAKLIPHMEGEERTLYAHLKEAEVDAEKMARHADEEHHEVKNLLMRLDQIQIESDEWDATFRKLKSCVEAHVKEEETELFNEAIEDFTPEELGTFAQEFDEVKHLISP